MLIGACRRRHQQPESHFISSLNTTRRLFIWIETLRNLVNGALIGQAAHSARDGKLEIDEQIDEEIDR